MIEEFNIERLNGEGRFAMEDSLAVEGLATITVNGREAATLSCSPEDLDRLAVGFLVSEGLVGDAGRIDEVAVDRARGTVSVTVAGEFQFDGARRMEKRYISSGCGKGVAFSAAGSLPERVDTPVSVSLSSILRLVKTFQQRAHVFRVTGGVHSAALTDGEAILAFKEDIGRHNAVDKVFGECLLGNNAVAGRILLTSGRISSDLVLKAARMGVPVLVSKSAPTSLAVHLACDLGLTLIGFVRGGRANVYTYPWRIKSEE